MATEQLITFDVVHAYAQGLWPDILSGLGVDPTTLKKRHGPCPGCGGKDRFRFHNKNLRGNFFCNTLGKGGDGFQLLQHVYGWDDKEALKRVAAWLGLQSGTKITKEEREAARKRAAEQIELARKAEREAKLAAAQRAWKTWQRLPEQGSSAYLERKKVSGFDVRYARGMLAIPVRRVRDGVLTSIQWIPPEDGKQKLFTENSEIEGCCHVIGQVKSVDTLVIAEGYATGASVYMATGLSVAVAFNAGNLLPVAKAWREKLPHTRIVIAGDDDTETLINGEPFNTGRIKATEAAAAVGGVAVFPDFSGVGA